MPIYVYEVILEDEDEPGHRFEIMQRMSDPPLTHHPTTGQPVRRVVASVHVSGEYGESSMKANLSDKNLQRNGFTKYVKAGDGYYEKRAGQGPDVISGRD